jgi:hypothetical protein
VFGYREVAKGNVWINKGGSDRRTEEIYTISSLMVCTLHLVQLWGLNQQGNIKWVCSMHSRNEIYMETSYNKTSWETMTQTEDVTKQRTKFGRKGLVREKAE